MGQEGEENNYFLDCLQRDLEKGLTSEAVAVQGVSVELAKKIYSKGKSLLVPKK